MGTAKPTRTGASEPTECGPAYHHGNLREALIAQALKLAEEGGLAAVSVRAAARLAGVSPAAPFRHFPDKMTLMTAVAEEAMRRFRAEIARALALEASDDPMLRIRAIGRGYLSWARRNPTHFEIISSRRSIDFEGSSLLGRENAEIQGQIEMLLQEASQRGLLRCDDRRLIQIAARALVYGLARMLVDGHFPSWQVAEDEVEGTMTEVLDLFVDGLVKDRPGR